MFVSYWRPHFLSDFHQVWQKLYTSVAIVLTKYIFYNFNFKIPFWWVKVTNREKIYEKMLKINLFETEEMSVKR